MKGTRDFPVAVITEKGAAWAAGGHPWLYEGEVVSVDPGAHNGSLVDAVSTKGRYIGTGFLSVQSKIRIRLISRNTNDRFDRAFWARRVQYAYELRKTVMGGDIESCRIIFGESDQFPGLTVDRFNTVLVAETLSAGTEQVKDIIFEELAGLFSREGQPIRGIYERNESPIRALEGLPAGKGWYEGAGHSGPTQEQINENGIKYIVDFENGQKTGYFLDQKYNRRAVAMMAKGKRVLDCFTHTGSFALNAAAHGAQSVTAVDISETALETAKRNAALNGLAVQFVAADVFDLLSTARKGEYDLIILDPPAFTKSRKTVVNAERGYKEINLRAMQLLSRGGYLATCSCSHFMPNALFERMLRSAAADAAVQLRQLQVRQQAPDHPILWNVPETDYLKFYIFQVI